MNLYEVDQKYKSHPDYPYSLHVRNVVESFSDESHKIAATFHDIGKLSEEFQKYIDPTKKSPKTTHALESALFFLAENNYHFDGVILAIFLSIIRHHLNLKDTNDYLYIFSYIEDILHKFHGLEERLTIISQVLTSICTPNLNIVEETFDTNKFVEEHNLCGYRQYFNIKEVFSRLIFADKYEAIFKEPYSEKVNLYWNLYITKLVNLLKSKENKMSGIRNQAREEVLNKFVSNQEKKVYFIEAPTGLGKTFIALHLALEIAQRKNKKRIINVLPMTSIIDQTYDEYRKIFEEDILLKYHHLTYSKNYENDTGEEANYLNQKNDFISGSWSNDQIIITTFNQLFACFYSNNNSDLVKFWTIRDSVIIMDEIQAVPRVLLKDFSETIEFLSKEFNIDFILMSATIPDMKNMLNKMNYAELLDDKYFSMDFNNRYFLSYDPSIRSILELSLVIQEKICAHNSLLCILNTKSSSLELYNLLVQCFEGDELCEVYLLNTNFIPKHRKKIIDQLKERLKVDLINRPNHQKKTILISTQVVEAGVDLDFDIGIREFSPLYSIIQMAGRVNREGNKKQSEVIITKRFGKSPYHKIDLMEDTVCQMLNRKINENELLPFLKAYFQEAISQTYRDYVLKKDMEVLNFEKVYDLFNENFMKSLPYISPVFIEIEAGLWKYYSSKIESINNEIKQIGLSLEKKLELRSQLHRINKEISSYIINVPEKDISALPCLCEKSFIKVCENKHIESKNNNNEIRYSNKKGWLGYEDYAIFF